MFLKPKLEAYNSRKDFSPEVSILNVELQVEPNVLEVELVEVQECDISVQ